MGLIYRYIYIYIYRERERERERQRETETQTDRQTDKALCDSWAPHRAGRTEYGVM